MNILVTIFSVIFGLILLSVLLCLHEMGHFFVGLKLGFTVKEFSIFMGPRLFSWERKGIRYSIKSIPIGASVQFAGEFNGSVEDNSDYVQQPGDFYERPWYQRMIVGAAGPVVNLISGILIFFLIFTITGYNIPVLSEVAPNSQAAVAGLEAGDRIIRLEDKKVGTDLEIKTYLVLKEKMGEGLTPYNVTVKKENGEEKTVQLNPEKEERYLLGIKYSVDSTGLKINSVESSEPTPFEKGDTLQKINGQSVVGLDVRALMNVNKDKPITVDLIRDNKEIQVQATPTLAYMANASGIDSLVRTKSFLTAIPYSFQYAWGNLKVTGTALKNNIIGKLNPKETISGPIGIVNALSNTVSRSELAIGQRVLAIANFLALISLSLGIMNFLPIAPLDGNIVLLSLIEGIRKKPVSSKVNTAITVVGLLFILMIFVLGFYYDILRLLGW